METANRKIPVVRPALSGILFLAVCAGYQPGTALTDQEQPAAEPQHQDLGPGILLAGACDELPALDDATLLAQRILEGPRGVLLADHRERTMLALELETVLHLVRDALPDAVDVRVHPRHAPGQLLIHFEPDLWKLVEGAVTGSEGGGVLRDIYPEFDALTARLGLAGFTPYPTLQSALLCFDDQLDVEETATEFMQLKGIAWAEPNAVLGDGPDVHAFRWQDHWMVIVEDAHGDCPSGCIDREFHYFSVMNGRVDRLTPEEVDRVRNRLESSGSTTR